MPKSKFSDAKGNCSKEFGDHGVARNHALANNQTSDLHQTNQSVDGAPFQSIENQFQTSAEPESAVIDVENQSSVISQTPVLSRPPPSNGKLRKRKAEMKEIDDECKRKKNAKTSLEDGHVSLEDQCASMETSLERQKKSVADLKSKGNELTDEVKSLFMHVLQIESNRSTNEIQLLESIGQLQARNAQLQARNAQLRASIVQLKNESKAREANEENDSVLGQAKN